MKARHSAIQKKMLMYEKLLIKSPQRLNNDLAKNEARIAELEKLNKLKSEENEEQKRHLFERDKFMEDFRNVRDSLENFYNSDVRKAK